MARRLRFIPPGSLVEVTSRTVQGRLLMRPSPLITELTLGVLARAARLYPVEIHAFCFLSNHFHLLVTVASAARLAAFMNYLNSNLARELGRVVDWRERFWGRRYQAVLVDHDEAAQLDRLVYLLRQGTKEGLVRSPREWPGAHSTQALLSGSPICGRWFDRSLAHRSRRRRVPLEDSRLWTTEGFELSPLPAWRGRPARDCRRIVEGLVRAIEDEVSAHCETTGVRPLGAERICRQHPHQKPSRLRRTRVPLVHASSKESRILWSTRYRTFAEAFWNSARRLRAGLTPVTFPEGCFPPALPFVANPA
jgi:REP element-mobilizing transposase RayT